SYMDYPPSLEIDVKSLKNYKDHDLCLLVAGSQGQETSALSRIANGDFREVQIKNGDTVIFSADPIPGNEVSVNSLVDQISLAGAKVVYSDIDSGFHVSGHGSQGDLLLMMALTKPRYVLPIGSTYRHMVAYKNLAKKIGYSENDVLLPDDGAEIIFTKDGVSRGQKINIRNVFVDEISGEEVESMVLRDREKLSKEGMVVVMTEIDSNTGELINSPNVVARGFSVSEINTLTKGLSGELRKSMGSKKGRVADWGYVV
ncbi:MAG: ribonuclease J, partial [Candidatus Levybacteria bacterium]|nr:ribonuclease J [Candidatus Levybacteria bacterium]